MAVEVSEMEMVQSTPPTAAETQLAVRLRTQLHSKGRESFTLDVDFAVPAGISILFGPSGSGKTTILQSIAGLLKPDSGRVLAADRLFFDSEKRVNVPVAQRKIGYVFQNLALFPHMTVEENIHYGIQRLPVEERRSRTQSVLESFHIPHLLKRHPAEISGGERQRVALARSLVTDPCVLMLDEPLSALDNATKSRIIADLRAWNEQHRIPILYVTHGRREVFALGERVIFLEHGKILAQGTPHEVMAAPRHETIAQLAGFENIFDATVVSLHEDLGTMTCRLGTSAVELEVALARFDRGAHVRVGVRAGDILLATGKPSGISARNILPGRLKSLTREGVAYFATVDCGIEMKVELTPSAVGSLHLETGCEVWLVLKTYSCHLLHSNGNSRTE